jgi:glycosyltransferase involved in cell wall biosynthesis
MKIAIVLPDLRGGGAERLHVLLANDWVARGHSVEFVLMSNEGELLALVSPSVTVSDLAVARTRQVVLALRKYLRASKPDIVVAAMWPLTIATITARRLAGGQSRVIVSDHAPLSRAPEAQGWRNRFVLRASTAIGYPAAAGRVAVSKGVADDMARLGWLDPRDVTVIYNPAARGYVGEHDDAPGVWASLPGKRVITVGTLKAVKDHELLIRAFALVHKQLDASLVILGEGPLRAQLERLILQLGLAERVKLPGFVLDPYPAYLQADLFVLSSQYEGFGNVLVEAMECGLPVVSTDCEAGPREVLDGGQYGKLVPVGDAKTLAHAMLEALREPRQPARQQSRAAEFTVERASVAYLRLFESVTAP